MIQKLHTGDRGMVDLGPTIKAEYDKYFRKADEVNKLGPYRYWMLFSNILTFLKKKGFDPTKQY